MKTLATLAGVAILSAQPAPPKFEVVSIKPCGADVQPGARSGGGNSSPGRLNIQCQTVKGLINVAYVLFANGRTMDFAAKIPIEGGPAWLDSERFTIDATTAGPQKTEMMQGPMLQALLEDRFQLQIRRATREVPVYEITASKGGPKLKPFAVGGCVPMKFLSMSKSEIDALPSTVNYCRSQGTMNRGIVTLDANGMSLDDFIRTYVAGAVDHPIVNKIAAPGLFDIHLEYVPDENSSAVGPSISAALQEQLGLQLRPAKGPGEYLVIDHVEKPAAN